MVFAIPQTYAGFLFHHCPYPGCCHALLEAIALQKPIACRCGDV
jgi:hypothetical protein